MRIPISLSAALAFSLTLIATSPSFAMPQLRPANSDSTKETKQKIDHYLAKIQPSVTTSGSVSVDGHTIAYTAVTGTIPILADNEMDTTARMSFTAYFKKDIKDKKQRPVTFFYNGGPGSSTVWLHMGSLGPKRVVTDTPVPLGGAPYQLVDNQYSLLDASDLVFIDAPGTGFGRILPGHEKEYYGVDQDAKAFGQFIMRFITEYGRWNSPKFIFGESYGTTRSAVLCNLLQNTYSIDLNGVILLSQILNFDNSVDGPDRNPGNDMPYELALPTYAATAWYHQRLPQQKGKSLPDFLKEVEAFALGDYAQALIKGASLDSNTFNQIAEKLHDYTGLPVAYIKKANLRIDGGEFEQNLLGMKDDITGRLDTRFAGPALDPLSQRANYDPMASSISSAYISSFNDYVRTQLNYGKDMYYRPNVYGQAKWDWKHHGRSMGLNVMPDLANAMKKNPKLQVMLNAGYYDLATPYFEGIYELQHLNIPKSLQKNIHYAFYESGHMVYLNVSALKKLHDNVKQFIELILK